MHSSMFGILEKNDEIEVRGALLDFVCNYMFVRKLRSALCRTLDLWTSNKHSN